MTSTTPRGSDTIFADDGKVVTELGTFSGFIQRFNSLRANVHADFASEICIIRNGSCINNGISKFALLKERLEQVEKILKGEKLA